MYVFLNLIRVSLKVYSSCVAYLQELLELGDRIGYVSTGLGEDEINMCLRRTKLAMLDDLSLCFASDMERKCSICQVILSKAFV